MGSSDREPNGRFFNAELTSGAKEDSEHEERNKCYHRFAHSYKMIFRTDPECQCKKSFRSVRIACRGTRRVYEDLKGNTVTQCFTA